MSANPSSPRQRFYKPWHVLSQPPLTGLREVFSNYTLEEMKQELQCWLQLALCNDNSAYRDAGAREDLLDFVRELQRLAEALYIINEEKKQPERVIHRFCKTFRQSYAQAELLDMLDAVITYKGEKEVYKGNLVLLYEHLYCLVKLAYGIGKHKKDV